MTPPDSPDGRTAYDLFWAAVEGPAGAAEPVGPADPAGPTDAYAAFDAAAHA
jgi:hypothetical protein